MRSCLWRAAPLWVGLFGATQAAEPTPETWRALLDDMSETVVAGVRADLRGPCRSSEAVAATLLAWSPWGEATRARMAELLVEHRLDPSALAAWVAAHPEEVAASTLELRGLERVMRRYARRCEIGPVDPAVLIDAMAASPGRGQPPEPVDAPPERGPAWGEDLDAALAQAQASGRPVLVWFSASWAMAVRDMERTSWSDERVMDLVARCFIPLRIDVTAESEASAALLARWGVKGVPTTLLVDARGEVLGDPILLVGSDPDALLSALTPRCEVQAPTAPPI